MKRLLKSVIYHKIADWYYCDACPKLSVDDICEHCQTPELWNLKDIIEDEIERPEVHNADAIKEATNEFIHNYWFYFSEVEPKEGTWTYQKEFHNSEQTYGQYSGGATENYKKTAIWRYAN